MSILQKMLAIAGRDSNGKARAIRTNEEGNLQTQSQLVGSIALLGKETKQVASKGGVSFHTALDLGSARDITLSIRSENGDILNEDVEIQIVWAVAGNRVASSNERVSIRSSYGQAGAGVRVPALGTEISFMHVINHGINATDLTITVLGGY